MDEYNSIDDNGDNVENRDIGNNNIENQEAKEAAAEQTLDIWINSSGDPREGSEESIEDDDDTNIEEVLMTGVAPSHEEVNGEAAREPLSSTLKRKQRMDEILQQEDGESELEDEQMTDIDQEESVSAPIPEGLCVECRDQVINYILYI